MGLSSNEASISCSQSRYSAVYGWGPCENGFPSRGHQRGSASAAAQAWLEKEIYSSNPSKSNICLRRIRLTLYGALWSKHTVPTVTRKLYCCLAKKAFYATKCRLAVFTIVWQIV